jgi:hypothetical protein
MAELGGPTSMVVPSRPEPLRPLSRRDEIDEAVDEILGTDDAGSVGWSDAVLLVGGAISLAAGWTGHGEGWLWLGGALVLLGLVMPVRAVATRRHAHHAVRLARSASLLDIGHPDTAELSQAYARCIEGRATDPELASAAHHAVREVASALHGRTPSTAVEIEYVRERCRALDTALQHRRGVVPGNDSRLLARQELERDTRTGSVARLEELGGSSD